MPKYYLNKSEREFFIWCITLAGYMNEKADEFEKIGRKELSKWMRMSKSFILKVTDFMAKPLTSETRELVLLESRSYIPSLVKSKDYSRNTREMELLQAKIKREVAKELPENYVFDLAERVLEQECKKCDGYKPNCHLKSVFQKLEIPPFDESGTRCEFKIETEG